MGGRVLRWRPRSAARRLAARAALVLGLVVPGLAALSFAALGSGALGSAVTALAADPVPGPAPYGGQLDAPEADGVFDGEHALEVAMLALGSVNGLALTGVVIVSRFRGSTASATRRALMARTERGVPSGSRRRGTRTP